MNVLEQLQHTLNSDYGEHLLVDGLWGHRTGAAVWKHRYSLSSEILHQIMPKFCTQPGMIINGNITEVGFPVYTTKTKLRVRPRKSAIKQIILHHDGCNSVEQTLAVLNTKLLSTHFIVDSTGIIIQIADPIKHTAIHAGTFNNGSVGIDINNNPTAKTSGRPAVCVLVGKEAIYGWGLYEAQQYATEWLVEFLVNYLKNIDREWDNPKIGSGLGYDSSINTDTVGVFGHGEINKNKMPTEPHGFVWSRLKDLFRNNTTKE